MRGTYISELNADSTKAAGWSGIVVVWNIDARATQNRQAFDFSKVIVRVLPWFVTFREWAPGTPAETVTAKTEPGEFQRTVKIDTNNTTVVMHEKWHTDGVPDDIYKKFAQNGVAINDDHRRHGYRWMAGKRIEALRKALVKAAFYPAPGEPELTDAKARDVAKRLVEKYVTSRAACDAILKEGYWHTDHDHGDPTKIGGKRKYQWTLDVSQGVDVF